MGGNIVLALAEKYPGAFAGTLAACGVMKDWPSLLSHIANVRASYNYFTRGTAYRIPGEQSVTRSAVDTWSGGLLKPMASLTGMLQAKRVVSPMVKLFEAAKANPRGPEQQIIDNVATASHTEPDLISIGQPVLTSALGMNDLNETLGGSVFDNTATAYHSDKLDAAGNAALNAGIERVRADPKVIATANQWYQVTGRFDTKMLSIYNAIDPLVRTELEQSGLRQAVEQAGNSQRLVQRSLPSMRKPFPGSKVEGYIHCGFTPTQIEQAWNDLRHWVEQDQRPTEQPAVAAQP